MIVPNSVQYGEIILLFSSKIEKIVTTIALPDRSEVEELSSDYAQSILDKVSGHFVVQNVISRPGQLNR